MISLFKRKNKLCVVDACDVCMKKLFAQDEENGPLIDLRNLRKSNAKINDKNQTGKYDIINGHLNLLGWVVLKSKMVMTERYDETLAYLNIIAFENYWEKLVNTDNQRSILFPGNYDESRFDNIDIPFGILKPKFLSDYDIA